MECKCFPIPANNAQRGSAMTWHSVFSSWQKHPSAGQVVSCRLSAGCRLGWFLVQTYGFQMGRKHTQGNTSFSPGSSIQSAKSFVTMKFPSR